MQTNINEVKIKSADGITKMREAGHLTSKVLEAVGTIIRPGITTLDINAYCHAYIVNTLKAIPGSLGQYDFPYTARLLMDSGVLRFGSPIDK